MCKIIVAAIQSIRPIVSSEPHLYIHIYTCTRPIGGPLCMMDAGIIRKAYYKGLPADWPPPQASKRAPKQAWPEPALVCLAACLGPVPVVGAGGHNWNLFGEPTRGPLSAVRRNPAREINHRARASTRLLFICPRQASVGRAVRFALHSDSKSDGKAETSALAVALASRWRGP